MNASVPWRTLLCVLALSGCQGEEVAVSPPPLPQAPPLEPADAPAVPEPSLEQPRAPRQTPTASAVAKPDKSASKTERPKGWGAAYVPTPAAAPVRAAPTPTPVPKPAQTPAAAAPVVAKPKTRVTVPRTDHVHAEIPSRLQADLDADPRMQAWVDKVIAIADGCHAKARTNVGTIEAQITMHENDRPDPDVRSLPPQLGALVACATGQLMRTKMPLFTGHEGTRYTVHIVFE